MRTGKFKFFFTFSVAFINADADTCQVLKIRTLFYSKIRDPGSEMKSSRAITLTAIQ
jgi:hypothetical protein